MSALAVGTTEDGGCGNGESFALRVIGHSMAPEFHEGDIVIIEPEGAVHDGAFVLALHDAGWIFRQLRRQGEGWSLHALNPAWPDLPLADLQAVRGVIIQKSVPGRRRLMKRYV